jgi:hypothetical protein
MPPALAKPITLSKAEARPTAREDPPTRPDALYHGSLLVLLALWRDLNTLLITTIV